LFAWERYHLDSFFPTITNETGVPEKFVLRDNESGWNLIPIESGDSPQVSKGVECSNYPPLDESPHKTIYDQPLCLLSEDSPLLPGYGEPALSEHSLDKMLTDLVPNFREVNSPVNLPIF
jgi:hypothetical protein